MARSGRKDLTTVEYLRARERLDRDWGHYLSPSEVRVLGWLMSMTFGWRNAEGSYSLKQMLLGIRNRDAPNEWWVRGVGLSHFTLRRALKRLEDLGVLRVRWGDGKKTYAINRSWTPRASDGSRVTSSDPVQEARTANAEHAPCSNSTDAVQISSAQSANDEHPYKTSNTRHSIQATPDGTSPNDSGSSASWTELTTRLNEYREDMRDAHISQVPPSGLSPEQRDAVFSHLSDEDSWAFQALVYRDHMPEREALLEVSRRIALRGEEAQFKEGKRVKAKRLYRLADLLRMAATSSG